MNSRKRFLAGVISISLLTAYPMSVLAADQPSKNEKEEVVYAMMEADGSVEGVYVVNSFNAGTIKDYGNYTDVKLLNIDGNIQQNGDEISFLAEEKAYYQGTLKDAPLPWKIAIRYYIDGKEYTAKQAAGKNGKLRINIVIEKNDACTSDFYDNFAIQATFTLNTDICRNIQGDGATIANVGSNKQITYTVLPGKGLNADITADVTDFEMPSAALNGIRMNLNLDTGDRDINEEIDTFTDGAVQLDDGAKEVYSGTVDVNQGVIDLNDGVTRLETGIETFQSGLNELYLTSNTLVTGSAQVKQALLNMQAALTGVSVNTEKITELTEASGNIKDAIDSLYENMQKLEKGVGYEQYKALLFEKGLNLEEVMSGNEEMISTLTEQIEGFNAALSNIENVPAYAKQAAEIKNQIAQLEMIVRLLSANNAALNGTEGYLTNVSQSIEGLVAGTEELKNKYAEFDTAVNALAESLATILINVSALSDGVNELVTQYSGLDAGILAYTNGVSKLYSGYADINSGIREIAEGCQQLSDGTNQLKNGAGTLTEGTGELREKTSTIQSTVSDKLGGVLETINSEDYKPSSFVSEKNTNVSSVQFVFKTKAVKK